MSHHSTFNNRQLDSHIERAIRFSLRAMGILALVVCLIFWLSLLLR